MVDGKCQMPIEIIWHRMLSCKNDSISTFTFALYIGTSVSLARIQLCQARQSHAVFTYPTPASLPNPHQITFCLHFSNQKRECDNSGSRGRLSDCLFVQSKTQFRGPHSDATDSAPDWERVSLPELWPQSNWIPAWNDNGFEQIYKWISKQSKNKVLCPNWR